MGRNKVYKDKVTVSFSVEKWLLDSFDKLVKHLGITRGELIARSMGYYSRQWHYRNIKKRQDKDNSNATSNL
jgi:hypothetical protein